MTGIIARIVLRYIAAALVARGLLTDSGGDMLSGDTEVLSLVTAGLGIVAAAVAEGWYYLARRFGWST